MYTQHKMAGLLKYPARVGTFLTRSTSSSPAATTSLAMSQRFAHFTTSRKTKQVSFFSKRRPSIYEKTFERQTSPSILMKPYSSQSTPLLSESKATSSEASSSSSTTDASSFLATTATTTPTLTREQHEASLIFDHYQSIPFDQPSSSSSSTTTLKHDLYQQSHASLLKALEPLLDVTKQQQALQTAIKASNAIQASSPSAITATSLQKARQPTVTIHASSNNTILTLAGANGEVISWASGGSCGLKKSARGSSESGLRAAQRIAQIAKEQNIMHVNVVTKGFGQGKEEAFRTLRAQGLKIGMLSDATPIPHGGCRPRKRRRV